jgi:hypothetical protein
MTGTIISVGPRFSFVRAHEGERDFMINNVADLRVGDRVSFAVGPQDPATRHGKRPAAREVLHLAT